MGNDPRRFLRYLEAERNASLLYRALADTVDGDRREALLELAQIEDEHAEHWVEKLTEYGVPIPPAPTSLDPTDAALVARARGAGFADVLRHLEEAEGADAGMYDEEPEAPASMSEDEREHIEVFAQMRTVAGVRRPTGTPAAAAHGHRVITPSPGEPWHRGDKSGSTRAAVFGVSDGLVSNTALVMGFAGASTNNSTVLFAGLAGLLAGAFSMAAGEYVSVASQRDLFRREIAMEASELRDKPEEEQKELELIYRAKGVDRETAAVARSADHVRPQDRPRHPGPRGARPRSRRARLARARRRSRASSPSRSARPSSSSRTCSSWARAHRRPSRWSSPSCWPSSRCCSSAASSGVSPAVAWCSPPCASCCGGPAPRSSRTPSAASSASAWASRCPTVAPTSCSSCARPASSRPPPTKRMEETLPWFRELGPGGAVVGLARRAGGHHGLHRLVHHPGCAARR